MLVNKSIMTRSIRVIILASNSRSSAKINQPELNGHNRMYYIQKSNSEAMKYKRTIIIIMVAKRSTFSISSN